MQACRGVKEDHATAVQRVVDRTERFYSQTITVVPSSTFLASSRRNGKMCLTIRLVLRFFLVTLVITGRTRAFSTPRQCHRNDCRAPIFNRLSTAGYGRQLPSLFLSGSNDMDEECSDQCSDKSEKRTEDRHAWLERATQSLLDTQLYPPGSLKKGKWHELTSMMTAWSKATKDPKLSRTAPLVIESILKRIIDEQRAGNAEARTSSALYNLAIDAWATSSTRCNESPERAAAAAQRAREILIVMQATYEAENSTDCRPDEHSFLAVLQAVSKQREGGAASAKDMLMWMEELYKNGRNPEARPTLSSFIIVLDAFASSGHENAGLYAEELLSRMTSLGIKPNTLCYNIAIKAWSKARRGRTSAEHAERLLDETPEPDVVTYSSVIHAWATSGMRTHAAERAEEILQKMEATPNIFTYNSVLNAWCKSGSRLAIVKAEELLHRMEHEHQVGIMVEGPDLFSYNTYIHALSINGREPGMAQRADAILTRLEEKYDAGEIHFSPNLFSYNLVIEAWSRSREKKSASRACAVLRRLVKRDGVEADTFSYNQAISALSRSSLPGAARKAEELLQYMESAYRSGTSTAKPDVIGYSSAIIAWSRSREDGSAQRAERLLNRMQDRYAATGDEDLKPNTISFNSVIDAWARSREGTLGARKAESLLQRMQKLYEAGDDTMQPNLVTYNAVLNAWARSGTRCCAYKAEHYLERMWQLYEDGNSGVKPDGKTYNTVS